MNKEQRTVDMKKGARGWTIVVMPDNIRIDSFHGFAHMHIHRKHPHLTIDVQDAETVYKIVTNHLERNGKVETEKLVEELGGKK